MHQHWQLLYTLSASALQAVLVTCTALVSLNVVSADVNPSGEVAVRVQRPHQPALRPRLGESQPLSGL